MSASPRRRQRTHTPAIAVATALILLFAGMQSAAAGSHRVRLVGSYRPVAVDGFGWGRTDHYLESGGDTYLMQRGGDFPSFTAGTRVEVDGTQNGTKLQVDTVERVAVAATATRAAPRLTTDTRKVLAILVDWTAPDSVTPASAINQLESLDDAWYDDASYGQVRIAADATPWLTIPTPTGCDDTGIMNNAFSAATTDGWDLSAYDHLLVYFPTTSACGWAGMAYVGGSGLWINGYMDTRVTVHELGHNLGLWHAHSVTCTDSGTAVPWSTSCGRSDYGDPFDAMGGSFSGGVGRFNAAQANELDWMRGRKQTAPGGGGTYSIAPLGKQAEDLQALRLPGADHDLWVEYRKATGIDSWLPSAATAGVILHVSTPSVLGSDIIDMTPGDADFTNGVVQPGWTWVDPLTDWSIHVNSVGSNANVTVAKPVDTVAPTFGSAPHAWFASSRRLPERGRPVQVNVKWAASDAQGSVSGYDVRMATDGGPWTTLVSNAQARWTSIHAAPKHTYTVQVRAADDSGNLSAWVDAPPISLTMLSEGRLRYSGGWSKHDDHRALGNAYRVTTQAKAFAVLHTKASAVALVARVGPSYGSFRVLVDGHRKLVFSQNANKNGYRLVIFRLAWGYVDAHTIRFVNVGTHGHPSFSIDGVAVLA